LARPTRFDLSQLFPGTQVSTYAQALSLIGTQPATGIRLVVDGGWSHVSRSKRSLVDNVTINGTTFTFEGPALGGEPTDNDACKGWRLADVHEPELQESGAVCKQLRQAARSRWRRGRELAVSSASTAAPLPRLSVGRGVSFLGNLRILAARLAYTLADRAGTAGQPSRWRWNAIPPTGRQGRRRFASTIAPLP